ncbi:MAG: hypothetical protein V4455_17425 [Pseudomonadota bacterium]
MGISSFSPNLSRMPVLSALLAPWQALLSLFVAPQAVIASSRNTRPASQNMQLCTTSGLPRLAAARATAKSCRAAAPLTRSAPSRLRIVRAFEAGMGPSCAGRMVISGRMADVCAELDRMAQRESVAH